MSAVQVLAVTASGFAVVGLADVVLRHIYECVQHFRRCHSASDLIPKLLRELLSLSTIATNVRVFLGDYTRSLFALEDGKVLLDFSTILRDCERELEILKDTATSLIYTPTDPWHARLLKSLRYGSHSERIEKSCFQLERLKSSLNSALSVTGRQNDIALREAIGSTHEAVRTTQDRIRELSQQNQKGFSDVTTAVRTNYDAIQNGVAGLTHDVQGVETTITTRTDQIREDISRAGTLSETQHSTVTTTLSGMKMITDRSLDNIIASRKQQQRLLRQQRISEHRILASMKKPREQTASPVVNANDAEMRLSSVDLEALAPALCLMRREFERSLDSCVKEGIMDITIPEASWIHKEFEGLLAASYTASARAINHPANHSGTRHPKTFGSPTDQAKRRKTSHTPNQDATPSTSLPGDASTQLTTSRHNHRNVFPTPVGILVIQSDKVKGYSNSNSISFRFVFSPNPDISSVGVSAKLTKTWNALQGYTIQQQIRPSYVMRHDAKIDNLLVADDVAGIQALFSAGEASPFDCNEKGWSILDYAAWRCAPQVYKFLLELGAGNDTLYPRSTEVAALTRFQPESNLQAVNCFQILALIIDRRLSSMWGRGGSLLHDLAYFDCRWDFDCLPFEEIIDQLLEDGEEIDARDETGCTPLLNACYLGCSPTFIALLLRKGADVNALDTGGWNALHQVLYNASRIHERYGRGQGSTERDDYIAYATLKVLLRANCSLDAVTKDSQSHADFARFREVRRLWNGALYDAEIPFETRLRVEAEVPEVPAYMSSAVLTCHQQAKYQVVRQYD